MLVRHYPLAHLTENTRGVWEFDWCLHYRKEPHLRLTAKFLLRSGLPPKSTAFADKETFALVFD